MIVIKDERQFLKILVSRHKTASTYGPANLFLNAEDFQLFEYYYELRINETDDNSLPFFVINDSSLEKRYTQHIQDFAKFFKIDTVIPTPTDYRKAGSTQALSSTTQSQMEHVSRHMTHSSSTAER